MITKSSLCSRVVGATLALALSGFTDAGATLAQDISGGAGVLLASADVEARLGKGIFSTPKNVAHAPKRLEKKTVTRAAHPSRPQRTTTAGNKPEPSGSGETPRTGESSKPLGEPAKTVLNAEALNKQGDDYFDAGQYQKAIDAYQQAVKLQAYYPEAYLNLGEAYFNLGRYDEAVAADKQAILLKPDWAAAYHALGNSYLKLDRSAEALDALKQALSLDPKDSEARNALSVAYDDQGVAAHNASK